MVCFRISDAIFEENVAPRTDEDKLRRKKSALNNFQAFVRPLIQWCVGKQDFESGTKFIFEGLQDPIINKHVSEKIFSGSIRKDFWRDCVVRLQVFLHFETLSFFIYSCFSACLQSARLAIGGDISRTSRKDLARREKQLKIAFSENIVRLDCILLPKLFEN